MINKGIMSSNTDEWATPQKFYDELNRKFEFTLDPCATTQNHKCDKYNKEWNCKAEYCRLLKDFLYIQDQVKDCGINEYLFEED